MAELWSSTASRGVGAGHVDDRGHGVGASSGNSAVDRRRAVRFVAGAARDAGDAALLLAALGLDPAQGRDEETAASMGWVWVWRGYRDDHPLAPLTTPEGWASRLRREVADGAAIRDEYGQDFDLDELLALVAAKATALHRNSAIDPRDEDCVAVGGSDVEFREFS